jgi:hypothetical protein
MRIASVRGDRRIDCMFFYYREMARGFESKMVEFQQEEAARGRTKGAPLSADEQERRRRREGLELARARAAADLERATAPAHKRMLEQALATLDEQLRSS